MAKVSKKFDKGVLLKETTDAATLQGELRVDSADDKLKIYLDGSERSVVTANQAETLTNKTIDVDNNTVSNIETDNLKAGVLNTSTSLAGASDLQVPSALATKTYVDNAVAGKDQASEISYSNATSGLIATNVQDALDEIDGNVDSLVTLSGVALDSTNLGTFTGSTIPDNQTNKQAFQALETAHEAHLNDSSDAHAASAITNTPSGNLAATTVQAALNELQSDIDTRALNSDLSNHLNDTTDAHDASAISSIPSGNLAATDVQGALNELQSDIDTRALANGGSITNADINLGTASNSQKLVVSKDSYANLNALTREEASLYYASDLDKLYVDDGSSLIEVGSGGGQGGINHITNNEFEIDASGWVTYADAANAVVENGTGGTATSTFTRSTSSPLRGLASGLFSKPASNEIGEGVSYDFTIDNADTNKILEISFDYTVSTNYQDGFLRCYVYDVTNAVVIEPATRDIPAHSSQTSYKSYFQTASNSTSYRLIFHVATSTSTSWDFKLDNVKVGPLEVGNPSIAVSDWQSYIPTTNGLGTLALSQVQYRRVGDSVEIQGKITTGTTTAVEARVGLPPGLTSADTSKIPSIRIAGHAISAFNSATYFSTEALIEPSVSYITFGFQTSTLNALSKINGTSFGASGVTITFQATVPIQGFSTGVSPTGVSQLGTMPTIAFRAEKSATQIGLGTSPVKITYPTAVFDYGGGYDAANSRFIVPESGLYQFQAGVRFSSFTISEVGWYFRVNGVDAVSASKEETGRGQLFSPVMNLVKGDIVEVFINSSVDASWDILAASVSTYFTGYKITNPSQAVFTTEYVDVTGIRNYLTNPNAETDLAAWNLYQDASAALPENGIGGTATASLIRSTVSPLRGSASFVFGKAAINEQGEGVSTDFTIDNADQAKMLEISFDYTVTTNYVDGNIRVYVYDVTNAQLIEPSQRDILANSGQATYRGYFQANSNSTSYRLIFHVATTSALAYDLKFDNVRVGPVQAGNAGTFVSDYIKYTPGTQGLGTISLGEIYYRRIGDSIEIFGSFTAGTVSAVQARLNYPTGFIPNQTTFVQTMIKGHWWRNGGIANSRKTGNLLMDNNAYIRFASDDYVPASAPNTALNGDALVNTGDRIFFHTTAIPIQGWSTGVSASEIPSNSVIGFKATLTGNQSIVNSTLNKVTLNTVTAAGCYDTAGAFDTVNNRFVAPETGLYYFNGRIQVSSYNTSEGLNARLTVDGSTAIVQHTVSFNGTDNFAYVSATRLLNKGQTVELGVDSQGDTSYTVVAGSDFGTYLEGFKINNPAQIAPTEVVAASYSTNASQSIANSPTITTVLYEDKAFDTHNAYNTSTGEYTVPVSGIYQINAKVYYNTSAGWASTENAEIRLDVNRGGAGYQLEVYGIEYPFTGGAIDVMTEIYGLLNLNRGDLIRIRVSQSSGAAITLSAGGFANKLEISRIK